MAWQVSVCRLAAVARKWIQAAGEQPDIDNKVAMVGGARRSFAPRKQAAEIVSAFDGVPMDFSGAEAAWRCSGGRDLEHLAENARADHPG